MAKREMSDGAMNFRLRVRLGKSDWVSLRRLVFNKDMAKLILLAFSLAATAFGSDDKTDRTTLKGIQSVCTVVEVAGQAKSRLEKEELQAAMEKKLAGAGIAVDKNATMCLYLNARTLQAIGRRERPMGLYAVDLRLEFLQTVALSRDAATKTYAPTWSVVNMATVSADDLGKTVREISDGLVDQFVNAYRSVNSQ
jgi:hypothetical protein